MSDQQQLTSQPALQQQQQQQQQQVSQQQQPQQGQATVQQLLAQASQGQQTLQQQQQQQPQAQQHLQQQQLQQQIQQQQQHHVQQQQQQQQPRASAVGSVSMVVPPAAPTPQPTLAAATNALRSPSTPLPQLQVISQPIHNQAYLPPFQGYQSILLQNPNALAAMNQMNQLNLAMQQQQQNRGAVTVNSDGTGNILSATGAPQMTHMSLANGGTALIPGMQTMLSQAAAVNNNAANNTSNNGKGQGQQSSQQQQQQGQQQQGAAANNNKGAQVLQAQAAQAVGAAGGAMGTMVGKAGGVIGGPQAQAVGTPMVLGQIGVFSSQPNCSISSFVPQSSIANQQAAAGIRLSAHPQPQQHGLPTASVATVTPGQAAQLAGHPTHQMLTSQNTMQSLLANQLMQAMASLQMQQQGLPLAAGQHQILSQGQAGVPTIFTGQNFLFRPAQGPIQQQPITVTSMQAFARPQQQQQLPQQQQIVKTNASGKVMLPSVQRTPITAKIQPSISQTQQQVRPGVSSKAVAKARPKAASSQQIRTPTGTPIPTSTISASPTRFALAASVTPSSAGMSSTLSSPSALLTSPIALTATASSGAAIIAAFPTSIATVASIPAVHQVVASVVPTANIAANLVAPLVTSAASTTLVKVVTSSAQALSSTPTTSAGDLEIKVNLVKPESRDTVSNAVQKITQPSSTAMPTSLTTTLATGGLLKAGRGGSGTSSTASSPAKPSSDSETVRTQIGDIVMIEERRPSPSAIRGLKTTQGTSASTTLTTTTSTTTSITTTLTTNSCTSNGSISTAAMEAAGLMTLVKEPTKPITIVEPSPQLTSSNLLTLATTSVSPTAAATMIMAQSQQSSQHTLSGLPPLAALTASTPLGSAGTGEKQKAIVKPHILTHIIEGFVIHEGSEPFPVQQSSLLQEFIPPKASLEGAKVSEEEEEEEEEEDGTSQDEEQHNQANEGDAKITSPTSEQHPDKKQQQQRRNSASAGSGKAGTKAEVPSKEEKVKKPSPQTPTQKLPPKMLKCELCQKIGPASTFSKSGRFCSMSCSGRHNVSHTRRVGLFKSKGSARKRKMIGSKKWRANKGRRLSNAKGGKNEPGNDDEEDDEEEEEEMDKEKETTDDINNAPRPAADEMSSSTSAQETSSSVASPAHAQDLESMDADANIPTTDPGKWSVVEVYQFIYHLPGCREYADEFRSQEIDGQALLLLKEDHLMTAMNIKLGPALKICSKINSLRAEHGTA